MTGIIFTVRLNNADWDAEKQAWRCPALEIPGSSVQEIFASGERIDKAWYEILTGPVMIRWVRSNPPHQISAVIAANEDLSLRSDTNRWKTFSIIVPIIASVSAAIISGYFTYIASEKSLPITMPMPQGGMVIPGDLTSVFGKRNKIDRVEIKNPDDNTKNLNDFFSKSQSNIKIVTIDGASWILDDSLNIFEQTVKRIPVKLLMMDYTDNYISSIWNDAMNAYGTSVWNYEKYKNSVLTYDRIMKTTDKLSVGFYNNYPWTRFTIFDDNAVSFIITPNIKGGKGVISYFSEDPFIVKCFEAIFQQIEEGSRQRGHIFSDPDALEKFVLKNIR